MPAEEPDTRWVLFSLWYCTVTPWTASSDLVYWEPHPFPWVTPVIERSAAAQAEAPGASFRGPVLRECVPRAATRELGTR